MVATVLLHGVEDSLGLEAGSFQRCSGNVTTLCVLGDTEDGTLCIINPVWCEETGECSDEDETAVVVDSGSELRNLLGVGNETLNQSA